LAKLTFDEQRCKGCALCVPVCPKQIMALRVDTINDKGYHPAGCVDISQCVACAFCARMCPDCVITVEK